MHHPAKTAIVTGATSGIGLAIARTFLNHGYNVVGNARNAMRLEQTAAELGRTEHFLGVAGDIAEPATARLLVERSLQHFGRIDVLINNAGLFIAKPFTDYATEELEQLLATNLKGVVYASQAVAAHMVERRCGHIRHRSTNRNDSYESET